jgi:hypothetical protein
MAHPRHRKVADRSPLSVQEPSCGGHHGNDRVGPEGDIAFYLTVKAYGRSESMYRALWSSK